MVLFWNIDQDFLLEKAKLVKKAGGFWEPVIGQIWSAQALAEALSEYTIKMCIGRHRNGNFWTPPQGFDEQVLMLDA